MMKTARQFIAGESIPRLKAQEKAEGSIPRLKVQVR